MTSPCWHVLGSHWPKQSRKSCTIFFRMSWLFPTTPWWYQWTCTPAHPAQPAEAETAGTTNNDPANLSHHGAAASIGVFRSRWPQKHPSFNWQLHVISSLRYWFPDLRTASDHFTASSGNSLPWASSKPSRAVVRYKSCRSSPPKAAEVTYPIQVAGIDAGGTSERSS